MDGVQNLSLGDHLAAADDVSIGGIFLDERVVFLRGEGVRVQDALAGSVEVRVVLQLEQVLHNPGHHDANGGGAGEAGGLDGGAVHKAGGLGHLADDELMAVLVGPKTRKGGDDLPHGQIFHVEPGLLNELVQARAGGGGGLLVLNINGRRAHQQVAVDGGGNQHALAVLAGQGKNGVLYVLARLLVQQAVIAPAGGDMNLFLADHVVELVGVHPCGIDHAAGLIGAVVGLNLPAARDGVQAGDLGVKAELHAVGGGVLRHGDVHAEGAHNTGGGGVEDAHGLFGQVGLQLEDFLPVQNQLHVLDAILDAPLIQGLQVGQGILVDTHHQGAAPVERKIQLLGQVLHHLIALHVQLGHQGSVGGVVACVNNGAVGLGGAAAHVLRLLQHTDFGLVPGQLAGGGAPGHTGPNDDYVIHRRRSSPFARKKGAERTLLLSPVRFSSFGMPAPYLTARRSRGRPCQSSFAQP